MATATSEFAKTLSAKLTADVPQEILTWGERVIDGEMQEVRGVLSLTADRRSEQYGHCWCRKDLTNDAEPHNDFCQRARALFARLQPEE